MNAKAGPRGAPHRSRPAATRPPFPKAPSGIAGFDEITQGGLPRDRATLVCGGAGSGKTLFGMSFLMRGILDYGEPGAFFAFEESPRDLAANFASLGFEIEKLVRRRLLSLDYVQINPAEIAESGAYDLEGLFLRLGFAIDSVGAKRVVIDTLENLFGGLSNQALVRAELARLFRWLKEKRVTAVVTAERGGGSLTRHGLEEYVSDCVILLDHRVQDQISTRRLRVVKYRGSSHGTNEYPFLIDEEGIAVAPITGARLDHKVFDERVTSGIPRLDTMLEGRGYFRGSTILVSGTAGTGKTSVASHFADATCRRGERCLFFTFEESPDQLLRNMRSIGIHLDRHRNKGLLSFSSARPTNHGLEMHLGLITGAVDSFSPSAVVLDPVTDFRGAGSGEDAHLMLVRLIDFLKSRGITAFLTSLTGGGDDLERTQVRVSSIVDTWILLKSIETGGERNRGIYVLKSRGMAHSNQIREFLVSSRGVELVDVSTGAGRVLTGSARIAQEAQATAAKHLRRKEIARKLSEIERKRSLMEQQIAALRDDFETHEREVRVTVGEAEAAEAQVASDRAAIGRFRWKDPTTKSNSGKRTQAGK